MEFIDELYQRILVDEGGKPTTAHIEAVKTKKANVGGKLQYIDFKQIENAYQLFRKKHSEFPEHSFRRYCWVQLTYNQKDDFKARKFFRELGWKPFTEEQLKP